MFSLWFPATGNMEIKNCLIVPFIYSGPNEALLPAQAGKSSIDGSN
jgi:hypothetical protein